MCVLLMALFRGGYYKQNENGQKKNHYKADELSLRYSELCSNRESRNSLYCSLFNEVRPNS